MDLECLGLFYVVFYSCISVVLNVVELVLKVILNIKFFMVVCYSCY